MSAGRKPPHLPPVPGARAAARRALALAAAGVLAAGAAFGKSAQEYFHGAAYMYVAGRQQEALIQAEEGLGRFPDDAALKSLADHLRKLKDQKQQDQGSQGSSQGDQGRKDDKGKDQQPPKPDQGGEGDKGGEDKEKPPEGGQEDKGEDGKEPEAGEADEQDGKDSSGQAMAPVKPGEMSKEDAERLLNSIQDDEKKEHRQQQRRYRKRPDVEQDW